MHSCPNCYEICHCDGDDLVHTGDEKAEDNCTHCQLSPKADEDELEPEEVTA